MVATFGSLGVSRGVGIAVAALLTAAVVFVAVFWMKRRADQRIAAMSSTEAQRYESRRIRVGFAAGLARLELSGDEHGLPGLREKLGASH